MNKDETDRMNLFNIIQELGKELYELGFKFEIYCQDSVSIYFEDTGSELVLQNEMFSFDDEDIVSLSDPKAFEKVKNYMVKQAIELYNGG